MTTAMLLKRVECMRKAENFASDVRVSSIESINDLLEAQRTTKASLVSFADKFPRGRFSSEEPITAEVLVYESAANEEESDSECEEPAPLRCTEDLWDAQRQGGYVEAVEVGENEPSKATAVVVKTQRGRSQRYYTMIRHDMLAAGAVPEPKPAESDKDGLKLPPIDAHVRRAGARTLTGRSMLRTKTTHAVSR